jgi:hypothetical protein
VINEPERFLASTRKIQELSAAIISFLRGNVYVEGSVSRGK